MARASHVIYSARDALHFVRLDPGLSFLQEASIFILHNAFIAIIRRAGCKVGWALGYNGSPGRKEGGSEEPDR